MVVVAYDVADDARRERLSNLLSGYGPRVQLSVFEARLSRRTQLRELRAAVRRIIDHEEDQVRFYELSREAYANTYIVGAREIEEHRDFWLIT